MRDGFTSFAPAINALKPPIRDAATLSANLLQQTPFFYFSKAGRAPYFSDWNFTIERQITSTSLLRTSYHGVVGNKLLSRQQSQNQLDPKYWAIYGNLLSSPVSAVLNNPAVVAAGFSLPYATFPRNLQLQQALRPFPQYSDINSNAGGQNDGHSTFHALEASYEHRFSKGLFMMASYTFAKLISGSNGEDANRASDGAVQNQYNRRLDKAVASQDTPHNLRVSYVYDIPFFKNNRYLGGWKVSAIHTYVSGTPLVVNCSQNLFGAGSNARCSFAPGVSTGAIPLINPEWNSGKDTAFRVPYLNKAAFVLPPNMTYGDTPRRMSYLRTPWTINEDIALIKDFKLTEKVNFEIRGAASNAFNRSLLAAPVTAQNNSAFGFINTPQGNGPRNIQLGARVSF
ncbi:MAG: hypothetical protein FJW30_07410 [Acidobacteria bacterium]|nr:hypothetical protein [Acidobacteriota bacterium]